MNPTNEVNKKRYSRVISDEFPKLIEMFNKHLDFKHWGFELIHSGVFPQYLPYIVYLSNQCQIRFRWEQDRPYESPAISVSYGRLHAPIDQYIMAWNEVQCYCWHEIGKALNFLDGLSPSDTTNREFRLPHIMREFSQSSLAPGPEQEYLIKMHSYIWAHYGQRLFDLFDLRRPDLWNEYRSFLKQYYIHRDEHNKLKGISPSPAIPPLYNVC